MYQDYDEIVKNIKTLIRKSGMKQCVVAERAGFNERDFSNMLNERRKLIRAEYLPGIASALGVDINDLYYLSSKEKEVV